MSAKSQYKTSSQIILEKAEKLDAEITRLEKIEQILKDRHQEFINSDPELATLIFTKSAA